MNLTNNPQISQAVKKINDAAEQLYKQTGAKLEQLIAQYEDYSMKLEDLKSDIKGLQDLYKAKEAEAKTKFQEQIRVAKFDLDMKVKEHSVNTFHALRQSLGYSSMTQEEAEALLKKLDAAKDSETKAVKAAQAVITRSLEFKAKEASLEKDMTIRELQFKVSSLQDQLKTSQNQLVDANKNIDKLQDTITKVAEAGQANINVNK